MQMHVHVYTPKNQLKVHVAYFCPQRERYIMSTCNILMLINM